LKEQAMERERVMQQVLEAGESAADLTDEEQLVIEWRLEQLEKLGVSRIKAALFAGFVDWHDIAALVARGCSAELAVEIVR
jgi:hypothetical protein